MGELKNKGREAIQENQDRYQEIQETGEEAIEERDRNMEIVQQAEGVDDETKAAIESAKDQGREIAEQTAQSAIEAPKNEVNEQVDNTVNEMQEYGTQESDTGSQVSAMDGAYGGVGSNLESQFEQSADEFNEIATSGSELKETSNEQMENMIQQLQLDW